MDLSCLHRVQRPSRYLGTERNAVRPDPAPGDLRAALSFPDLYEIGMSHLGMGLLYHCLNRTPGVVAERVFLPDTDLQQLLRERGSALGTLESATPLHRLDLLGFTLAYELTYTNVLAILDLGKIPLRSSDRTRAHPVVLAGGPCAFNPEPMAAFIDAFIVGEAEFRLPEICRLLARWKAGGDSREALLEALDREAGLYVPSRFARGRDPAWPGGRLVPLGDRTGPVRKCLVPDLDAAPVPDRPVVPFARVVHDRVSIEAARGCPHGCRFCQAGVLYRPYRERSPARVLDLAIAGLRSTGHADLSLLALSIGDYTGLAPLTASLMHEIQPSRVALSLPSIRVGSMDPAVAEEIVRVRKTGFTLAPEAATERLRNVINKNIDDDELVHTARLVAARGWRALKLYFMIGLPSEQDEDVQAIARLSERLLRAVRATGARPFQITVNVSTFVPKAHTPFQWEPQLGMAEAERRQAFLKARLRKPGLKLKWHDPRLSLLEGLFARGDRSLCDLLEAAYRKGCVLDGWTEHLRFDLWQEAFAASGIEPESRLHPFPDPDAPLPWAWIDPGVDPAFLRRERLRAHQALPTPFRCRGDCASCGACRPEERGAAGLPPAGRAPAESPPAASPAATPSPSGTARPPRPRMRLLYAKQGPVLLLSHLETINVFYRALRRSGLPICFTEGEHPQPRVSFTPALPVGAESCAENLDLWFCLPQDRERLKQRLQEELPEGFTVLSVRDIPLSSPSVEESIIWMEYEFLRPDAASTPADPAALAAAVEAFRSPDPPPQDAPAPARAPLCASVQLHLLEDGAGLRCRIHKVGGSLASPARVLEALFPGTAPSERTWLIRKTKTAFLAFLPAADRPGRRAPKVRQGAGRKK